MITTQSLLAAIKKIKKKPHIYNQGSWCGTQCCVAGHAMTNKTEDSVKVQRSLTAWAFRKKSNQEVDLRLHAHKLMQRPSVPLSAIESAVEACAKDKVSK